MFEAPTEAAVAFADLVVADGQLEGAFITDEDDEAFSACEGGVEEVSLEHDVVLCKDRDHDGGVFAALAFVYADGVSECEGIEFVAFVGDLAFFKHGGDLGVFGIDIDDESDVSVKDFFVVVIAGLEDAITRVEAVS